MEFSHRKKMICSQIYAMQFHQKIFCCCMLMPLGFLIFIDFFLNYFFKFRQDQNIQTYVMNFLSDAETNHRESVIQNGRNETVLAANEDKTVKAKSTKHQQKHRYINRKSYSIYFIFNYDFKKKTLKSVTFY